MRDIYLYFTSPGQLTKVSHMCSSAHSCVCMVDGGDTMAAFRILLQRYHNVSLYT